MRYRGDFSREQVDRDTKMLHAKLDKLWSELVDEQKGLAAEDVPEWLPADF